MSQNFQAAKNWLSLTNIHLKKLLYSQWDVVSENLGGVVIPDALRSLYLDKDLISKTVFDVIEPSQSGKKRVWDINQFFPADGDKYFYGLPQGSFVFACSQTGDPYYLTLASDRAVDGPVYMDSHGEIELVAASLQEFLSWVRQSTA